MNIANALKVKNRIAGEIARLRSVIANNNNKFRSGDKAEAEIMKIRSWEKELLAKEVEMIEIKTKIQVATNPIVHKLIEMQEAKSKLAWIKQLQCEPAIRQVPQATSTQGTVYVNVTSQPYYSEDEKERMVKQYQDIINNLQDEIDAYNGVTQI